MSPIGAPPSATLDAPEATLRWLATVTSDIRIGDFKLAEVWALAAIAALARRERSDPAFRTHVDDPFVGVTFDESPASKFAYAIGIDRVIQGTEGEWRTDRAKTVTMARVTRLPSVEPLAAEVARLLVTDDELEDTRRTIEYVLRELLRNVLQHSMDPLGGVVVAQRSDRGSHAATPVIQVAVVDDGIGIEQALRGKHPTLVDAEAALDKALWPHISGTFEEGQTGSTYNAGMGLFFIAEMTKLVEGRLLLASRGATLALEGDRDQVERHGAQRMLRGTGYPGTLVAFEMPEGLNDYDAMIETIKGRAQQRTPSRSTYRWLRFDTPPHDAIRTVVSVAAENVVAAQQYSATTLVPRIVERKIVVLDLVNFDSCTQSFVHALLFEAIRVAWALKVPIYVANARPAVRSSLELLESYALAG
ncbi:MAG: sensor histidine kinase [Deltaproteobacteria bacterium]|nr:sensor histidine kinase [Deltaproteobacteria bacterium]